MRRLMVVAAAVLVTALVRSVVRMSVSRETQPAHATASESTQAEQSPRASDGSIGTVERRESQQAPTSGFTSGMRTETQRAGRAASATRPTPPTGQAPAPRQVWVFIDTNVTPSECVYVAGSIAPPGLRNPSQYELDNCKRQYVHRDSREAWGWAAQVPTHARPPYEVYIDELGGSGCVIENEPVVMRGLRVPTPSEHRACQRQQPSVTYRSLTVGVDARGACDFAYDAEAVRAPTDAQFARCAAM